MKFEVRCCCMPQKLLGYLTLPDSDRLKHGLSQNVAIPGGETFTVRFLKFLQPRRSFDEEPVRYLAIPSDDRPIEFWRTVPGFSEFSQDEILRQRVAMIESAGHTERVMKTAQQEEGSDD